MSIWIEDFSATCKESDEIRVLVPLCSVAYISFCGPHLEEACPLVPIVDHCHLLAVHLDAVAGKDIDDEELDLGLAFDLLQQSFPDFINGDFTRVDQLSHVVHAVATEGIYDYFYVFVDFG